MNTKLKMGKRRGVSAIEFAIVAPIVLLIVFGLFEVSRVMTINDSVRTSVIAGVREAGVANTTADNVKAEIESILNAFRVRSSEVVVTPTVIDAGVTEISIDVTVPLNTDNGVYFQKVIGPGKVAFSTVLER